jgi:UDP-N-acetylmuramate--alanine ligase
MQHFKRVHMVGIGGIGMSALAQLYQSRGIEVTGSDREASPVTVLLEGQGIPVLIGTGALPADVDLLVYSDAVPQDNAERVRARERSISERSYFQALGDVSRDMATIAVTGTHGKTTTTGMLAVILAHAGKDPTAVVGSIVRDFPSNAGGSNFRAGSHDLLVVEACEYRDHVLEFRPRILVLTNVELDHTDYFSDLAALQETFRTAIRNVPDDGTIVTDPMHPNIAPLLQGVAARIIDYTKERAPELTMLGEFNRANARAAKAAAKAAYPDIPEATIDEALAHFRGSWRRFEYKGQTARGAGVYDDYAHHPTAIARTLESAREQFLGKRIVVAFHPHLYSRTKAFLGDFAASLAKADEALIAPIYAAREAPDPSVSNETLAEAVSAHGGHAQALPSFAQIRERLETYDSETLIILMGAGDIYRVAEQIVVE